MKRTIQVWSEGYRATGDQADAMLHGTIIAKNFQEACNILFKDNDTYDSQALTLWGCRLYNNEREARKSFG